ncbi:2-hydroxyacyl-CoA dehydratase family protein [Myxococcota bacterium]|nr:2-hydroxyacyl-CoA dehydratase family protein [Myxococcota bacterium]MBU1380313.1 2-hydroxyacyl-CoA dehydratase family protein [Myxococcota bacterium]MBU1495301.1 2-hydroxyacyl-CoA dehydratase family protein [Myxococcota bacterium]
MPILEEFRKVILNPSEFLSPGKSIGYMCNYVPEELIHAAGFTPVRLNAVESEGTSRGDMYFSTGNCSFPRRVLDKGLSGAYGFLDGIVFMNGCDHNRRLYDNWNYAQIQTPWTYLLFVPHSKTDASLNQYINELQKLINHIESIYKLKLSEQKIRDSIKLYQRKRNLLRNVSSFRGIKLSGTDFLMVMIATTVLPPDIACEKLDELIVELKNAPQIEKNLRVLVTGNCVEEIEHFEIIENIGANIVYDNICLGSRYFDRDISMEEEPVIALAEGYLRSPSCPRIMNDTEKRIELIKEAVKKYQVDAVIIEKLEFCSMMTGEGWIMSQEFRKEETPFLLLTRELYGGGKSQIRTRIQAFYEKVKNLK